MVERQAVEARAVQEAKASKRSSAPCGVEHLDIGLQRRRAAEDAGATASGLLRLRAMRRRIGADEEAGLARGRCLAERQAMALALGDRQAIEMRPQAALEHGGAVDDKMMRRDGAGNARRMGADEIRRLRRGDVLDHDLQALVALAEAAAARSP